MGGTRQQTIVGLVLLQGALLFRVLAGGTGLNTVVVVNQDSSNSCALGNYFCERRQVPPENVLRIHWPGANTLWTSNDFQADLVTPLLDMLATRQLTSQIGPAVSDRLRLDGQRDDFGPVLRLTAGERE
jgi:hypothetical protein